MNTPLLALLLAYRYWILFPLAFIEGPVVALAAGWFVSLGYLNIVPTFIILLFGDLAPDTLYFWIGHWVHKANFLQRYGPRVGITEHRLKGIEHLWHTHTFKSALLAKWAYGMSTPLLMSAGLARLPTKKFLPYVTFITAVQYAVMLAAGYYFGSSYLMISRYIQNAEWIVAGVVLLLLFAYFFVSRYARRSLLKNT